MIVHICLYCQEGVFEPRLALALALRVHREEHGYDIVHQSCWALAGRGLSQ